MCVLWNNEISYILWSEFGIEDIWCDDVADGISSIERCVVYRLFGLTGAIAAHPGDEQRVDGEDKCDQVVADEETALVCFGLGKSNH